MSNESKELKLFGKWSFSEVEVTDPGLVRYISLRPCNIPWSGGRHAHKRFKKGEVNIVERLINKLMRPGKNSGKKIKATNIVKVAFEIIHAKTGMNPIQVLVNAIQNAAPREETSRLMYGGISLPVSVDSAPSRRVDQALKFIAEAVKKGAFSNVLSAEEVLANELIAAARNDASKSQAIRRKEEIERIALSAR